VTDRTSGKLSEPPSTVQALRYIFHSSTNQFVASSVNIRVFKRDIADMLYLDTR
jgi:hypothetical protein